MVLRSGLSFVQINCMLFLYPLHLLCNFPIDKRILFLYDKGKSVRNSFFWSFT